jgi:hypothetical protein
MCMTNPRASLVPLVAFAFTAVLGADAASASQNITKVAPRQLSDEIAIVDGTVLVPVDDLAAAAGCKLTANVKSRFYEAWPCKPGGRFRIDVDAVDAYAKSVAPSGGEEVGFNPQPDPPRDLQIDAQVISHRVVVHEGRAMLELGEVARLMGGTVKGKGKRARIVIPAGAAPLIVVAE